MHQWGQKCTWEFLGSGVALLKVSVQSDAGGSGSIWPHFLGGKERPGGTALVPMLRWARWGLWSPVTVLGGGRGGTGTCGIIRPALPPGSVPAVALGGCRERWI